MKIKIVDKGRKTKVIMVDVNRRECRKLPCFKYGHYTHYSSDGISCLTRDKFGCPDNEGMP